MEVTPKPPRGGRRDPLPKLAISIPNYDKYQKATNGRRDWVRVQSDICRNRQIIRACKSIRNGNPLAVFVGLVCMADATGMVTDVTAAELGSDILGLEYRSIQAALSALSDQGLITCRSRDEQGTSKGQTRDEQGTDKCSSLEQPSNDAALTPPTRQDKDITEQEIEREVNGVDSGPPQGASLPPPSAVDLIARAMAARQLPARGADAMAHYRAEAHGIVTRKPPNLNNQAWANWACMAIAAVDHDERWMIAVNTALKTSKMAGTYIPPETGGAGRHGKRTERAVRAVGNEAGGHGVPRQPRSIDDIEL